MDFKKKYIKYKNKYINLRNNGFFGGSQQQYCGYVTQPSMSYEDLQNQNMQLNYIIQQQQQQLQQQQLQLQQLQQHLHSREMQFNNILKQKEDECTKKINDLDKFYKNKGKSQSLLNEDSEQKITTEIDAKTKRRIKELEKNVNDLGKTNEYLKGTIRNREEEIGHLEETLLTVVGEDTIQKIKKHKRTMINDIRQPFFPVSGPFLHNKKVKHIEDEMTEFKAHPVIYTKYDDKAGNVEHYGLEYKPPKANATAGDKSSTVETPSTKDVLIKNFVSFLNTRGGRLYFGISDNLVVHGIKNIHTLKHAEHVQIEITKLLETEVKAKKISDDSINSVTPDFIMFIWHNVYNYDLAKNIYVLEIQIQKGSDEFIYMTSSQDIYYRGAATTKSFDETNATNVIEQRLSVGENVSKPEEIVYEQEEDESTKLKLLEDGQYLEKKIQEQYNKDIDYQSFDNSESGASNETAPEAENEASGESAPVVN